MAERLKKLTRQRLVAINCFSGQRELEKPAEFRAFGPFPALPVQWDLWTF